ncbi:hypothetical protein HKX48_009531 [Thoreauomyces humboldtii]|nr:hypothetical protein HKX48_009531 [Thoreauomyces humboldtii]
MHGPQVILMSFCILQVIGIYVSLTGFRHARNGYAGTPFIAVLHGVFLLRLLPAALSPLLPDSILRLAAFGSYCFACLGVSLLFPISYEFCHSLHGGPSRRLLYHDWYGRMAAGALAVAFSVWNVVDLVALSRVRPDNLQMVDHSGVIVPEVSGGQLTATWVTEIAGSLVMAIAGGCLWKRAHYPWLTISQLTIVIGRIVASVAVRREPWHSIADPIWDILVAAAILHAAFLVIRNSGDQHPLLSAPLLDDPLPRESYGAVTEGDEHCPSKVHESLDRLDSSRTVV